MHLTFIQLRDRCRTWCVERAHGPYATPFLFLLAFAESIFFPVPVDPFLVPLVIIKARSWKYYAALASLASVLGGIAGYALGFFLFSLVGAWIISVYGLDAAFATVQEWFAANALGATFISAFTPIPYKVFTLTAGFLHVPFLIFVIGSALGRSIRFFLVCYIAERWGALITRIFLRYFTLGTVYILGVALIVYILVRIFI